VNGLRFLFRAIKCTVRRVLLGLHRQSILKSITGGEYLRLEGKIIITDAHNLTLGRNVYIGSDAYINCRGGVVIGDYSILSRRVTIYSYDHNFKKPDCLPFDDNVILKPVHIGRYVWIGMNATIAPGTKIGDGAVIGMGCVVSGDIPKNAIVVNEKPRVVGYRDEKRTEKLALAKCFFVYK